MAALVCDLEIHLFISRELNKLQASVSRVLVKIFALNDERNKRN
jgi:hypothetical protein